MTPFQFVQKWRRVTTSERAAAQSHFLDLCTMLNHPTPAKADLTDNEILVRLLAHNLERTGG